MVGTGTTAPGFELPGTEGEEIEPYQLDDFTESGAVVLVFYPFDFSPVCTEVLCNFRDAEFLMLTEDVDVFGISPDTCYAHKRFIEEYELPFPLLSDTTGKVTENYGLAYEEWEHHKGVPKRALVTIDDSNIIQYKWMTEDAYNSPNVEELHHTIQHLSGEGS